MYATLSHRWGPNPSFFTLTSLNLPSILSSDSSSVTLSNLPQTFRDAILTCRRLAIRHLWIDSLCILQSGPQSVQDWQEQSREMHNIYAGGVLNIAVEHASSPEEGDFVERDGGLMGTCLVEWRNWGWYALKGGWISSLDRGRGRDRTGVFAVFLRHEDFGREYKRSGLVRRGWVAQERFFAPRVLRFTESRIWWQCYGVSCMSEYLAGGGGKCVELSDRLSELIVQEESRAFGFPEWMFQMGLPVSVEDRARVIKLWNDFVEAYSKCILTFPGKDRLVAASAVARRVGDVLSDDPYVAGIFQSTLTSLNGLAVVLYD